MEVRLTRRWRKRDSNLWSHFQRRQPYAELAPARIVNVSSAGQQPIDFGDVMLTRGYSGTRAYCQSKLAQIMFTMDLAASLRGTGVTVTCLHPATYRDLQGYKHGATGWAEAVEHGR
jgi:NAD(P)-dependent dehydrogenase (short-subunit alcohol dehydrogenase family)